MIYRGVYGIERKKNVLQLTKSKDGSTTMAPLLLMSLLCVQSFVCVGTTMRSK